MWLLINCLAFQLHTEELNLHGMLGEKPLNMTAEIKVSAPALSSAVRLL